MVYTTQGLMTAADLADHRALTDTGVTDWVVPEDLGLSATQLAAPCPWCNTPVGDHGQVIVDRASGDIVDCDY